MRIGKASPLCLQEPSAQGAGSLCAPTRSPRGYTLIEMTIVIAIISILVAIAVPIYQKSLLRTKESLLKNNLFTLSDASKNLVKSLDDRLTVKAYFTEDLPSNLPKL